MKIDVAAQIERLQNFPEISPLWRRRTHRKGEIILRQGDCVPDIFILESGLVKLFYTTSNGDEWVKSFIPDQGFFTSRSAQQPGQESHFSACCIEASEIVRLPYAVVQQALAQHSEFASDYLAYSEMVGLKKEMREYALLCLSAEQRCRDFLTQENELANRLSQSDIARYLGITPIAYSRIKKRVRAGLHG